MTRLIVALLLLLFSPIYSKAEYVATGPFEIYVCRGFVIKSCGREVIDAIKRDGKFYALKKVWEQVDEYGKFTKSIDGKNGICTLRVHERSPVWFFSTKPDFYAYDESGELKKMKTEGDVTFRCLKR